MTSLARQLTIHHHRIIVGGYLIEGQMVSHEMMNCLEHENHEIRLQGDPLSQKKTLGDIISLLGPKPGCQYRAAESDLTTTLDNFIDDVLPDHSNPAYDEFSRWFWTELFSQVQTYGWHLDEGSQIYWPTHKTFTCSHMIALEEILQQISYDVPVLLELTEMLRQLGIPAIYSTFCGPLILMPNDILLTLKIPDKLEMFEPSWFPYTKKQSFLLTEPDSIDRVIDCVRTSLRNTNAVGQR